MTDTALTGHKCATRGNSIASVDLPDRLVDRTGDIEVVWTAQMEPTADDKGSTSGAERQTEFAGETDSDESENAQIVLTVETHDRQGNSEAVRIATCIHASLTPEAALTGEDARPALMNGTADRPAEVANDKLPRTNGDDGQAEDDIDAETWQAEQAALPFLDYEGNDEFAGIYEFLMTGHGTDNINYEEVPKRRAEVTSEGSEAGETNSDSGRGVTTEGSQAGKSSAMGNTGKRLARIKDIAERIEAESSSVIDFEYFYPDGCVTVYRRADGQIVVY